MRTDVADGLRGSAVFSIPHGAKLRTKVQAAVAAQAYATIATRTTFPGEDVC